MELNEFNLILKNDTANMCTRNTGKKIGTVI